MKEIIIITIIIAILTAVVFVLLSRLVKMIAEDSKLYYLAKLQVYDNLIEEKEKKLNDLNKKSEDDKESKNKTKEDVENTKVEVVGNTFQPNYEIDDLPKLLKKIENNFNCDNEQIVKLFVSSIKISDNNVYDEFLQIKSKIEEYGLFEIAILPKKEQIKIMEKLEISKTDFFKNNKQDFNINEFMKKLTIEIEKNDPYIYIYVGSQLENYDNIHKFIKTIVDEEILKGIKIKYKGRIYDYSLMM